MLDVHLGCITRGKHHIGLLQNQKKAIYSAPCRRRPETKESEKAEKDEMLKQKVAELEQK